MRHHLSLRLACVAAIAICALPLLASRPYLVDNEVARLLEQGAAPGEKLVIDHVPVIDGNPVTLELERFEVWDPKAAIIVYEADGKSTHTLPRPDTRFYRGGIVGEPGSAVEVAVRPNGNITGKIFVHDRIFYIGRGVAERPVGVGPTARSEGGAEAVSEEDKPLLVIEFDPVQDLVDHPEQQSWECEVERIPLNALRQNLVVGSLKKTGQGATAPVVATGVPTSGVSYGLTLAIETDGELFTALGGASNVTAYLEDLVGAASTIYHRDLSTTLTMGPVNLRSNADTDPWTVPASAGATPALFEFGTYWHNNYASVARSSAIFISGKLFSAGTAWENVLCADDFYCGDDGSVCAGSPYSPLAHVWGGPYAFCGSSGHVSTTTPDPTLTVNGVPYGLPINDFWPLLDLTHELGHNANGPHTHCIPLDTTQQSQYGITRSFVDLCYGNEAGCYSGPVSAPPEKGTLMSYCHNILYSGSFRASRFLFYKAGEASETILGDTAEKCHGVGGGAPCYFTAGLIYATAGLDSTITITDYNTGNTVPGNLTCNTNYNVSVPGGAAAYSWRITGGSVSNQASPIATIVPFSSGGSVTLTASVWSARLCSITNTATRATQCSPPVSPPTNVVATAIGATSVSITWTAVTGATSYTVYRTTNNSTYTVVGSPAANSFTDSTAAAGTAYFYKVTASAGSSTSGDSNKDLATTVIFTDDPIPSPAQQLTTVKAVHFSQLRTAVSAVVTLAGITPPHPAYTDPTLTAGVTKVKAVHLTELRDNLDAARAALSLSALTYTDPTITTQTITIKATHITEVRNGVR
jgi:Metallo-peptidase family M12